MESEMDDALLMKRITLGTGTKSSVFKLLEIICDPEKQGNTKDVLSKSSSKSSLYNGLEYLKTISVKSVESHEVDKSTFSSNAESATSDENKKVIKRSRLKKIVIIQDLYKDKKSYSSRYMASSLSVPVTKAKSHNVPSWFTKRKYSSSLKNELSQVTDTKRMKMEWQIKSEFVYFSPDLFYKVNKTLTIDTQKLLFCLSIQDDWNEVELGLMHIKNITIFQNAPIVKIAVKSNVLADLKCISNDFVENTFATKLQPKKIGVLKDIIILFTNQPICNNDISKLKSIIGEEKLSFNKSDKDCQELFDNIFHTSPIIKETLLKNNPIDWVTLMKDKEVHHLSHNKINAIKNSFLNPKKSPIPAGKSPNNNENIVKLLNSSSVHTLPKLVVHQSPAVATVNNNMKPGVNAIICSQNSSFLNNHIVITTPLSHTRLDPYPNLFNRMINESAPLSQMSVHTVPNQNSNYSFTISNNPGVPVNNFSSLFQRQNSTVTMNNIPVIGTVEVTNGLHTNVNNSTNEMIIHPSHLFYIPGRNVGNIFESFNYAPSPDYNVLIHGSDLTCLNYGQYLNDNIINFYLNYIRYEKCSEDQRQRSHLFNVFFNTKLQGLHTTMLTETPEIRHARVAKWTKKVDIFDKDFVIIPINETNHWFLAIICFPWMAGMISYDTLYGLNPQQQSEIPKNNSEFAMKTRVERVKRLQTEQNIDPKPCILLFDSLQHFSRAPNVKLIREYLKSEWDAKRKAKDGPLIFDKNTIRGFNPQVPQQPNNIDCGVYVLHYVEMFFEHPLSVFTKEYFQNSLTKWFDKETVELKREFIQKLLLKMGESQNQSNPKTSNPDILLSPKLSLDDSGPDIQIL